MSQTLSILYASHAIIVRPAVRGGFAVYEHKDRDEAPILHACVADDEGLMEWFGEQLGFSSPSRPGPVVDQVQAEHPDIGQLAAEHMTAILLVADIRKALAPFVALGLVLSEEPDDGLLTAKMARGEYADLSNAQLRALLRAAGLFTDEMLPPPVAPGADAEQAGETTAPPAEPAASVLGPDADEGGHPISANPQAEPERDFEGRTAQDRYDDDAIDQYGQVELDDPMEQR
jgi:hypothetical protein